MEEDRKSKARTDAEAVPTTNLNFQPDVPCDVNAKPDADMAPSQSIDSESKMKAVTPEGKHATRTLLSRSAEAKLVACLDPIMATAPAHAQSPYASYSTVPLVVPPIALTPVPDTSGAADSLMPKR